MKRNEVLPFVRCPPEIAGNCMECPFRGLGVVYGPFPSRRRGFSLGINLFPCVKICSFNCVYCFRGSTQIKTSTPVESAVNEELLKKALEKAFESISDKIEAVDFSGSGEPTLHSRLDKLIETALHVVKEWNEDTSVGIFTNSSLLYLGSVRRALAKLDHIEAKLDTAIQWKFNRLNRPARGITLSKVVEGLRELRKTFDGVIAVQVMLVKYGSITNYSERDAHTLARVLTEVKPDEVHVYTTYRKPRLSSVRRAPPEAMKSFAKILESYGLRVEVYTE